MDKEKDLNKTELILPIKCLCGEELNLSIVFTLLVPTEPELNIKEEENEPEEKEQEEAS